MNHFKKIKQLARSKRNRNTTSKRARDEMTAEGRRAAAATISGPGERRVPPRAILLLAAAFVLCGLVASSASAARRVLEGGPSTSSNSKNVNHPERRPQWRDMRTEAAAHSTTRPLGGQQGLVSPPKLVQWSREAVQYHEGSTLVLSCSLSFAGNDQAPLKFAWFKQGKPLLPAAALAARGADASQSKASAGQRLSIETLADYSFLRLADLRPGDSGAYACVASNSLGQEDRTTTQVIVNVKLKWLTASQAADSTVANGSSTSLGNAGHQLERARAGQSVSFECNAAGGHAKSPRVRWYRLVPSGAATLAATPTSALTGGHHAARPVGQQHQLDEAQLRASLIMQMDSVMLNQGEPPLRRLEIANSDDFPQQRLAEDELYSQQMHRNSNSRHPHLKWRIETNSNPNLAMGEHQQHEVRSRLVLDRLDPGASGLYECEVFGWTGGGGGSLQQQNIMDSGVSGGGGPATSGDKLRKVFGLLVNGK